MDYSALAGEYIRNEIETLSKLDLGAISTALNVLTNALEAEKTVYVFGNGGSASTASHFQNDFNKGVSEYLDKKFRFNCLNDNIATVMAVANDLGYEEVFRFQLRGRVEPGDVVIAISGSGNSPNVINGVEYAKSKGATVIGLTGYSGGKLLQMSDVNLHADVNSMQISEDIHLVLDHLMVSVLYKTLCGREHLSK